MAKKPNTPCAGGCGSLLWSGSASLPVGQRMCRVCRRSSGGLVDDSRRSRVAELRRCGLSYRRIAAEVGVSYDTVQRDLRAVRVSTQVVRAAWSRAPHPCANCRTTVTGNRRYCADCRAARQLAAWQRKNLKRRAGGDQPMTIAELGTRDGWRCHLCRGCVDRSRRWPDPDSPSRDHLIPVADGGTNDPANLALAHLGCNVRRGTRGHVQLLLVG